MREREYAEINYESDSVYLLENGCERNTERERERERETETDSQRVRVSKIVYLNMGACV
jgi:hypothetical protein